MAERPHKVADFKVAGHVEAKFQVEGLQIGLHRISYPAPALAEIRPNFHIRPRPDMAAGYEAGYEVGFDHLSMHLPHCLIGQEFIVLQIR